MDRRRRCATISCFASVYCGCSNGQNGMEKIAAMIGAGLIGRAWAMVFARAGWTVRLYDSNPAQLASARSYIGASLQEQQRAGLCDDAAGAQRRINYVESLQHAVGEAEW